MEFFCVQKYEITTPLNTNQQYYMFSWLLAAIKMRFCQRYVTGMIGYLNTKEYSKKYLNTTELPVAFGFTISSL